MKTMIHLLAALPLLALHAGDPAPARNYEPPTVPTARPAPPSVVDAASSTPADLSVRGEEEQGCCDGMGGPVEDEPVVVVEQFADPDGASRRWLAPTDPSLERRYAPRTALSLNPITLRF